MNSIVYRPYESQDFKSLSKIINITWGHEKSYNHTTAVRLSNAYLRLCMTEQTFTQVALAEGKPIGIIMGNDLRNCHYTLKLRLQARWAIFMLSLTAEGRGAWHFFEEINQVYDKLLSEQPQSYEGELSFFAVHPDYRSLGIGKELYSRFLQYMTGKYIQRFYVFTDTSCNYGFYESRGLFRCGTEKVELKVNGWLEEFLFFIYENTVC